MKKHILLILIFSATAFYSQGNEIKTFSYNNVSVKNTPASVIMYNNNYYTFFYDSTHADSARLAVCKSSNGIDWSEPSYLDKTISNPAPSYAGSPISYTNLAAAEFKGKLVLIYKSKSLTFCIHTANGVDWSTPVELPFRRITAASVSNYNIHSSSNILYLTTYYNKLVRTTDLVQWTLTDLTLPSNYGFTSVFPVEDNKLAVAYTSYSDSILSLGKYYNESLQNIVRLLPEGTRTINPKIVKGADDTYYIVFSIKVKSNLNLDQWDVAYIKSTDNMLTWSQPVFVTKYPGFDYLASAVPGNSVPLISFFSDRTGFFNGKNKPGIAFAYLTAVDLMGNMPAIILNKITLDERTGVLNVKAVFANKLSSDFIYMKYNGLFSSDSVVLYDDGLHNDSLANDQIWGGTSFVRNGETIYCTVNLKRGNMVDASSSQIFSRLFKNGSSYLFNVNRLRISLNNSGIIGDVVANGTNESGFYDESVFLNTGGFTLSGKGPLKNWINGVYSNSNLQDYLSGNISGSATPSPDLFIVKNSDTPFSDSWIKWKDAVSLGAEFYDGNNDGVYNPIDLNGNQQWNSNEDKPFIIGDALAWCVFNDIAPETERRFNTEPIGIEIQQSVFASHTNDGLNNNTIYIRYKILNKSYNNEKLDSLYFSLLIDSDIGFYDDDLIGSDTLLNSGMVYNHNEDPEYGNNPPAFMSAYLQGPQTYIPGITFIDNNSNGIFDEGSDTPLDTAYAKMGPLLGVKKYPGAKNIGMTSMVNLEPAELHEYNIELKYFRHARGLGKYGYPRKPCDDNEGVVAGGVNCANVNPKYWYSGDPVSTTGWINTWYGEKVIFVNTGPFSIPYGKHVDIIAAYNVGRGTSSLSSITTARDVTRNSHQMYAANFTQLPLGVDDNENVLREYKLAQNYPNPFNPSTVIEFSIAAKEKVMLRIYDILGREVRVLVNEVKDAGNYKVQFNASSLSSGVYFYKLDSGSFSQTRKLLLLK